MGFLLDKCLIFPLNNGTLKHCRPFSCGENDLDDFFSSDADNYERQLLGKSYCFRLEDDMPEVICAFTLSNSSIDARNLPNNRRKKLTENIPHEKSLSSYPATLIGRLGVSRRYGGRGIGTELMEFIKQWLLEPGAKSACRYLTVDAYNSAPTLKFYETNGFKLLFSSERQEKEYIGLSPERELKTRLMYFDLIFIAL
jgi:GNAT superfamily N-acetyltransferase